MLRPAAPCPRSALARAGERERALIEPSNTQSDVCRSLACCKPHAQLDHSMFKRKAEENAFGAEKVCACCIL